MWEIRAGLEDNLDSIWYAKIEFNIAKMIQIKDGLENGIDVSKYAKSKISPRLMFDRRKLQKIKKTVDILKKCDIL